ncbi:hypothetical protein [Fodinibius sediminis]|uniref:hypothetical protein n=1 Tax=Fodinibius sediminis TaxID=1214077 RepID=UPI00115AFD87|nr:hypothetical protein [Fodinibius sediminis]
MKKEGILTKKFIFFRRPVWQVLYPRFHRLQAGTKQGTYTLSFEIDRGSRRNIPISSLPSRATSREVPEFFL